MLQPRELLEQNLIKPTLEIKGKRKIVKDIKTYLLDNHAIFEGSVQSWINDVTQIKEVDTRLLCLFATQIYQKTGDQNINPELFFTENEIQTSKQYNGKLYIQDDIEFPIRFKAPVIQHNHYTWTGRIHIKLLVSMLQSRLIHWNPDSQRESQTKIIDNEIVQTPTIYMKNVLEIKELLKKNKLEISQITLNASAGTSDDDKSEVEYNDDTYELLINKCKIDCLDGYHRILGSSMALSEKPDIDFWFDLKIVNVTTDRAAQILSQLEKHTPMSESKRKSMSKESFPDMVISELRKSKLGDRISKKEMLQTSVKELVTYKSLSSAIEQNFKISKMGEMYDVADYLREYFDILLEKDEFTTNYHETKKYSLMADNVMFYGYILLASRMMKEGIEARNVRKYIKNVDFEKTNNIWNEYGVLDSKKNLTKNPRKGIERLFSEIKL